MTTRKTILAHAILTAGVLAAAGWFFAQLAGMWVGSQSVPRTLDGSPAATRPPAADLTAALAWRLPLTMAAIGFALVAVGEGLLSIWRKPTPAPPAPTPEAEVQRLLRELEAAKPAEVVS